MARSSSKPLSSRGQYWRRHIERWQKSGLTQVKYCQEANLSVTALRWWKSELREEVVPKKAKVCSRLGSAASFTEVVMPGLTDPETDYDYEIVLANQNQLRLRKGFDSESVSDLLSLLGLAC